MRFRFLVLLILFLLAVTSASARPQQPAKPLSMKELMELTKAGMDSGELAQKVKQLGIDFDLTEDYIRDLRKAGAQDVLINALRAARPKPLTQDQVLKLVAGHVPSQRAAALVEQRGIDFSPDEEYLQTLRVAGAEEVLLAALRTAGKAATAQLEIETSPHAEIYLDGQLAGQVGDDGRLAVKSKPGAHSLRVTLTGKKDYQQSLSLVAGQESRIDATLVDIEKPASPGSLVILVENSPRCRMCRGGGVTSWVNDFFSQLPRGDWVAVAGFNIRTEIIADFTQDTKALGEAIARLPENSFQESSLFDALAFTADRIKTVRGKRSILVIATGIDTFSKLTYDSTLDRLRQTGVPVFGVELVDSSSVRPPGPNVLVGIAGATGGKAWVAQSENMMPDVREVVASLGNGPPAGEMRNPPSYQEANPGGSPGLNGIFRAPAKEGSDPTAILDIFDPAKKTPRYSFLIFFPDGRVKKGLITLGLDQYTDESQMRHDIAGGGNSASQWGVYQVQGDRGQIVFADPRLAGQQLLYGLRGEVWQMVLYPDRLEIQGDTYVRLFGGNGMNLEGVYKPFGDEKAPGITFTPDGEFIDEGILNSGTATALLKSGGGHTMAYGFSSPGPGRGTYNITRYGLHLNYANGKVPDTLFFLEAGETKENPKILYINNVKYVRVR